MIGLSAAHGDREGLRHPLGGYAPSAALMEALQRHVRQRLSAHAFPREIVFVTDLPKTPSGKLQRFLLRQAEFRSETGLRRPPTVVDDKVVTGR